MNTTTKTSTEAPTKKDQILELFRAGITNIGELSALSSSTPSYVASVLRDAKILGGYFDLYTSNDQPMNIYSALFRNRLGFRTAGIARRSVNYINRLYRTFTTTGDRAGQHHALVMALTMFNRAWGSQKFAEADIFRHWLIHTLQSLKPPVTLSNPKSALLKDRNH